MTSAVQTANPTLSRIRQRGYWRMVIHPGDFREDRIPLASLYSLLDRCAVRRLLWELPSLDGEKQLEIGSDWIGRAVGSEPPLEYWRFYQSGQFLYYAGLHEDWRDHFLSPVSANWQPGEELDVVHTMWRIVAAFELAARLVTARDYQIARTMHVAVDFFALEGRHLVMDDPRFRLLTEYKTDLHLFPYSLDISPIELIATGRQEAFRAVAQLFTHFGWQPAPTTYEALQELVGR